MEEKNTNDIHLKDGVISKDNKDGSIEIVVSQQVLQQQGIVDCAAAQGNLHSFGFGLTALYRQFKLILSGWKDQEILKIKDKIKDFKQKISEIKPKRTESETKKNLFLDRIEKLELKNEDIRSNPEKYKEGAELPNLTLIYILGFLLIFTTGFILLFYGSAAWSGWFESYNKIKGLSVAVFNPKAFSLAFASDFTTGLIVIFIPFFVMLLGFLHAYYKNIKNQLTSVSLLIFGLLIDIVLAIVISSKIIKANMLLQGIQNPPDPDFSEILKDPSFSMVIIFGFGAYIVWGLAVGLILKELEKKNIINNLLKVNIKEIKQLEVKRSVSENEIIMYNTKIQENEISMKNQEDEIDGLTDALDLGKFEQAAGYYSAGWTQQLTLFDATQVTLDRLENMHKEFITNIGQ